MLRFVLLLLVAFPGASYPRLYARTPRSGGWSFPSGTNPTPPVNASVKEGQQEIRETNILSPNGDGVNDYFIIKNIEMYPKNQVKIFDKAGRIVYKKFNYRNEWAGTYNGDPLPSGTYYYVVELGNGTVRKGFITIVRD